MTEHTTLQPAIPIAHLLLLRVYGYNDTELSQVPECELRRLVSVQAIRSLVETDVLLIPASLQVEVKRKVQLRNLVNYNAFSRSSVSLGCVTSNSAAEISASIFVLHLQWIDRKDRWDVSASICTGAVGIMYALPCVLHRPSKL